MTTDSKPAAPTITKPQVTIYTDGAAMPNPGKAGWAAILLYGTHVRELSGPIAHATNNQAELTAALEGIRAVKKPCRITVISDSQWLVKCGSREWSRNANTELWTLLDGLVAHGGHEVTFQWVRGHNGDQWNERADKLANAALRRAA